MAGTSMSSPHPPSSSAKPKVRRQESLGGVIFLYGLLSGMVLTLIVVLLVPRPEDPDVAYYRAVRNIVDSHFVREIDRRDLVDEALEGLVGSLDPYSRYYTAIDLPRLDRETEGHYPGIGVFFAQTGEEARILFPLPDSPAERAGLRVGDRLVSIDGRAIEDMEAEEWRRALREPLGATHLVGVESLDGSLRELEVRPDEVTDPTVRHARMLDEELGIGYVAIRSFSRRTPAEFDVAVEFLRGRGAEALVVDLRDNPGGILTSAIEIANRFVTEGLLVTTASRRGIHTEEADPNEAHLAGTPLVLLVDSDSASASEVVAGALQDHRVAVLVGEPTYGKGTVQTVVKFEDEQARVKLTTAFYETPSKRIIERTLSQAELPGLAPDLWVPVEAAEGDAVKRYLRDYSPPPDAIAAIEAWEQRDGLVLIERPPVDAQLDAALSLFRGDAPDPGR